jgi:pyruvate dehydrogenase E2 component (dihydrolipoamide acetyltransferase)
MASEIKLPELGENVEEGEVVDVKVAEGDEVREGQALLEVEADKSTVEVPSPQAGRVRQLLVKKGDRVHTGQALCLIEDGDGQKTAPSKASDKTDKEQPAPPKQEKLQAPAAAAPDRPAQEKQQKRAAEEEKEAPKGKPAESGDGQKAAAATAPSRALAAEEKMVPAGPATRRLARELGIDLAKVRGSAPAGRVTQEDVKAHVRQLAAGARTGGVKVPALPNFEQWGPIARQPLDNVRRKTAEQMSLSWSLVPHVTQHDLADITELEAFRKQQEGKGPKLTATAFALKAAAIVLRQFPQFNASLDLGNNQLVVKQYYHIGVAVDTERGLLVPVVRDVDKKSVHDLAQELIELAERARQKKLAADDMRGGTFTISNLGGIGGIGFTPIVNYPEVAILGLSRARLQPAAKDGQFVPRLLLPLSLSYDHRVIDGAAAARFTRRLAQMLENPMEMLLHA